jgi:hypothetical protein
MAVPVVAGSCQYGVASLTVKWKSGLLINRE